MKQASFGDFQVGQVLNPSVEDQGGFEFASGMDIFSEPGVLKASRAMQDVTLDGGLTLSVPVRCMVEVIDSNGLPRLYVANGSDIWESQNGQNFALFIDGTKGAILSLAAWNGYIIYATDDDIGRVEVGNAASQDDDYITGGQLENLTANDYRPMVLQGGTLKIGNGRYVASLDESFTFSGQALKLPVGYMVKTMAAFNDRLFVGANEGQASGNISSRTATIFEWRGILPATGSALPDVIYTLNTQGIHALVTNGTDLFAFPGWDGAVWIYTGGGFQRYMEIFPDQTRLTFANPLLEIYPDSIGAYEGSLLYSGTFAREGHGIYRIKDGRIAQQFVPSLLTPGESVTNNHSTRLVHSAFLGNIYISGVKDNTSPTADQYYFQALGTNRQNNAMVRTLWHRIGTDRFKRFAGVRLNLKPMAANTAVTVAYRTGRTDSFINAPHTITSANQHRPVIFAVRPRASEIQLRFTYTTSGSSTPEMTSYDVLFDTLISTR